jgi:hypothetical protein
VVLIPIDFDNELGDALRRTADTFHSADARALVHEGHIRGRRLRRRRTTMITAAVAAFAVVGVGGGVLAAGLGKSDGGSGVAAEPMLPTTAKATANTASGAAGPSHKPLTAEQVEAVFRDLLPKEGTVSGVKGRGTKEGTPYAHVLYDDGHGTAAVEASVSGQSSTPSCPSPSPDPLTTCSLTRVDGGTLWVYKGFEYSDHRVETKEWNVVFRTAAGASISVSEWNSAQEKDAPITRPDPPLTAAQLTAIVTSPSWQKVIDALPHPKKGSWAAPGRKPATTAKP